MYNTLIFTDVSVIPTDITNLAENPKPYENRDKHVIDMNHCHTIIPAVFSMCPSPPEIHSFLIIYKIFTYI